jgi:hypothetical protein
MVFIYHSADSYEKVLQSTVHNPVVEESGIDPIVTSRKILINDGWNDDNSNIYGINNFTANNCFFTMSDGPYGRHGFNANAGYGGGGSASYGGGNSYAAPSYGQSYGSAPSSGGAPSAASYGGSGTSYGDYGAYGVSSDASYGVSPFYPVDGRLLSTVGGIAFAREIPLSLFVYSDFAR